MSAYKQTASTFELYQSPNSSTEEAIKKLIGHVAREGKTIVTGDLVRNGHLQESVTLLENSILHKKELERLLTKARKHDIIAIG